jgi:hypothetical protein
MGEIPLIRSMNQKMLDVPADPKPHLVLKASGPILAAALLHPAFSGLNHRNLGRWIERKGELAGHAFSPLAFFCRWRRA